MVQLALVAAAVHPLALPVIAPSLGSGAIVAGGTAFLSLHGQPTVAHADPPRGHAFSISAALVFAVLLSAVTAAVSLVTARYGRPAADLGAAIAGVVDVHAAAASVFSLAAGGAISSADVLFPLLLAFTANTVSKLVAAWAAGGTPYAIRVAAGLLALVAAVWAPWWWRR
jgi:uncharacterized membrane protein (DUF4010 family)